MNTHAGRQALSCTGNRTLMAATPALSACQRLLRGRLYASLTPAFTSGLLQRTPVARGYFTQRHILLPFPRPCLPRPGLKLPATSRGLAARAMSSSADTVPTVRVAEAQEMLSAGAKYLDVRTVQEFQNSHPPGAINVPILTAEGGGMVPNPQFVEQVAQALPDKDDTIVLGCKSGRRSEMAWHVLDREVGLADETDEPLSLMCIMLLDTADYSNMANLIGGFDDWAAQGMPTVS